MNKTKYDDFLTDLIGFIPKNQIYTDPLRTLAWGTDASFYRITPRIVIRSDSEEQIQQIVRLCSAHHLPFTFRAAGTSLSGQSLSDSILIVAGKNWEGYQLNDDGSIINLQPGLTGGRVNEILSPLGRVFPPDPASVNSAMVGGIVCNNASGMSCGVHANSDNMLISARIILTDGTLLDTADKASRDSFSKTHQNFIRRIEQLRDKVQSNSKLCNRIKYKYSIKNVTGLNIRPLAELEDPFDIIAHSIVGSEGTLAFLAGFRMKTLKLYPFRASAMIYFMNMKESCHAVVKLKKIKGPKEDLSISAEDLMVKAAEMLDYKSLESVNDPVYEQYKNDVDAGKVNGVRPGDYHNLTAILTETKASTRKELEQNMAILSDCLSKFNLYQPVSFTDDPAVYGKYWSIRSGIFPAVGGTRPVGTSCLIEDVAFHIKDLPEATVKLQKLIADHGYADACIYGHAFEGNYHFILNQSFQSKEEVSRYSKMMHDVARLVIEEYDGSLKAEHGTGRNMAPFVKYEWGEEAYQVMCELKDIFDPDHLLNPGVIFNHDPNCFIEHLKPLPVLNYDFSKIEGLHPNISTKEMLEGVKRANKCIECGFCEINCVSCGLTLSSRMRIAVQREICDLATHGDPDKRLEQLSKLYHYYGDTTCAADGLCATSCPMHINTGDLTHFIRQHNMMHNKLGYHLGDFSSQHMSSMKNGVRLLLNTASMGRYLLGDKAMGSICKALHKTGLPLWTPAIPNALPQPDRKDFHQEEQTLKVVYLPSCLNQTLGLTKDAPVKQPLVRELVELCNKAGYEVIFPNNMKNLCCGQIWESKGMIDIADRKAKEVDDALWEASQHGRYPVICDQSPCLHRLRKCINRMTLYEPAEFITKFLKDRLVFHPLERPIAVHVTCSMREMKLADCIINLARMCSHHVLVPEGVGCCAFAGDKGFTNPELNRYALRKLRPQVEKNHIERGYSNSRTCEIGLQYHSGIPYMSIVYLVNECTKRKE